MRANKGNTVEVKPWDVWRAGEKCSVQPTEPEEDIARTEQLQAEEKLVDLLKESHLKGEISAKLACGIAYYAASAGLQKLQPLAASPGQSSGNYKKRMDRALAGTSPMEFYSLPLPCKEKEEQMVKDLCVLPLQEALVLESHEVEFERSVANAKRLDTLPPNYYTHPIHEVTKPGEPVVPLALFMDGVRFGRRNRSLFGVTMLNLATNKRVLTVALRKHLECNCGCLGWCSYFTIFHFLHWCLQSLWHGHYPDARHDGTAFNEDDVYWAGKSLQSYGFRACLVQVRTDWMEVCHSLGLPSWKHKSHPCFLCKATNVEMKDLELLASEEWPYEDHTWSSYCEACKCNEIEVGGMTDDEWNLLKSNLQFDKRKQGHHGLVLTKRMEVGPVTLRIGDRVELNHGMTHWKHLLDGNPINCQFWRVETEQVKHRNPLYDDGIGTSLIDVVVVDSMHTNALGTHSQFVLHALWMILHSWEVFGHVSKWRSMDQLHAQNIVALNSVLRVWMQDHVKSFGSSFTPVQEIRLEQLGKHDQRVNKFKAAENIALL
eukprot:2021334-Amphidinium_carterae.1